MPQLGSRKDRACGPNNIRVYGDVLTRYLQPSPGNRAADIGEAHVRRWRGELLGSGASPATVAKAYRLLKAIMSTRSTTASVQRSPCRVKGGGQDRTPGRPVLLVGEVGAPVQAMPEQYRALVLLAAFGSLRWGELAALNAKLCGGGVLGSRRCSLRSLCESS